MESHTTSGQMAAQSVAHSPLESPSSVVAQCTVCLDSFKEPKVLPCCHTFCRSCLEGILKRSTRQTTLMCPHCRVEHEVTKFTCSLVEERTNYMSRYLTQTCLPLHRFHIMVLRDS